MQALRLPKRKFYPLGSVASEKGDRAEKRKPLKVEVVDRDSTLRTDLLQKLTKETKVLDGY
jgi:hypothetical protein